MFLILARHAARLSSSFPGNKEWTNRFSCACKGRWDVKATHPYRNLETGRLRQTWWNWTSQEEEEESGEGKNGWLLYERLSQS